VAPAYHTDGNHRLLQPGSLAPKAGTLDSSLHLAFGVLFSASQSSAFPGLLENTQGNLVFSAPSCLERVHLTPWDRARRGPGSAVGKNVSPYS
jgi:hypothetical protein